MGCLEQHKEALFRRAGEEEKRLFHAFIWLFDASFTWPFLCRLFDGRLPTLLLFQMQHLLLLKGATFFQAVEKIEKSSAEKADGGTLAGCFRCRVQSLPQRSNWTPSLNFDRATFSIHIKCHPTALLTFPLGHARIHNRLKVKDQIQ